ncbi:MAG: phosphatase PAP2 family protein [Chloroflexota bacterium]
MDLWLFRLINGFAGHTPVVDGVMRLLVSDYLLPTIMVLTVAGLSLAGNTPTDRKPKQRIALQAGFSLLLANVLVKLCNLMYYRPRPFAVQEVNLLFYHPSDSSLPSNPAAVGFSLAVAVWLTHRRPGAALLTLAALWSLARVYCGVHYPLDIIVGAGLGGLAAMLIVRQTPSLDRLYDRLIELGERLFVR